MDKLRPASGCRLLRAAAFSLLGGSGAGQHGRWRPHLGIDKTSNRRVS
ncbi:MAG TPA: hypothetical protein VI728_07225 [Syntrophales bacterium]|nr:hypothetical protein [Syntrophales bacterium]